MFLLPSLVRTLDCGYRYMYVMGYDIGMLPPKHTPSPPYTHTHPTSPLPLPPVSIRNTADDIALDTHNLNTPSVHYWLRISMHACHGILFHRRRLLRHPQGTSPTFSNTPYHPIICYNPLNTLWHPVICYTPIYRRRILRYPQGHGAGEAMVQIQHRRPSGQQRHLHISTTWWEDPLVLVLVLGPVLVLVPVLVPVLGPVLVLVLVLVPVLGPVLVLVLVLVPPLPSPLFKPCTTPVPCFTPAPNPTFLMTCLALVLCFSFNPTFTAFPTSMRQSTTT